MIRWLAPSPALMKKCEVPVPLPHVPMTMRCWCPMRTKWKPPWYQTPRYFCRGWKNRFCWVWRLAWCLVWVADKHFEKSNMDVEWRGRGRVCCWRDHEPALMSSSMGLSRASSKTGTRWGIDASLEWFRGKEWCVGNVDSTPSLCARSLEIAVLRGITWEFVTIVPRCGIVIEV